MARVAEVAGDGHLAGGEPGDNQARVFFQLASDNSAAVVRAFIAALP